MESNKAAQDARIETLEAANFRHEQGHTRNIQRIAELEKEVSIIKDIPLQKLADNYELGL